MTPTLVQVWPPVPIGRDVKQRRSFTLGQRIYATIAVLGSTGLVLGVFTLMQMRISLERANCLAAGVARQSEIVTAISQDLAETMLAARTYSLTGEQAELEHARGHVDRLVAGIVEAQALSERQPKLQVLAEQLPIVRQSVAEYKALIEETAETMVRLNAARLELTSAGEALGNEGNAYAAEMLVLFDAEIAQAAEPAKFAARREKIGRIQELLALTTTLRVRSWRAQANRNYAGMEELTGSFAKMNELERSLTASSQIPKNLEQLRKIRLALQSFETQLDSVLSAAKESAASQSKRLEAMDKANLAVGTLMKESSALTASESNATALRMQQTERVLLIGFGLGALLSFGIATVVTRRTTSALKRTADALRAGSEQISSASGQVAASSQQLASGSSEQAASLEEISSSTEELSSMTKLNAKTAGEGRLVAAGARSAAENGQSNMKELHDAMDAIETSSREIGNILKTIDDLAFQTNLLALNAAVEAARAGDAGAGFAVVAEEVRNLAARSAAAAKDTASKIESASTKSSRGVVLSRTVSACLDDIVTKARDVDARITEVATACSEQASGLQQIGLALTRMEKVTQGTAATAEESAAASEELNAQAAELLESAEGIARLAGVSRKDEGATAQKPAGT
jgi:hypothetical protein